MSIAITKSKLVLILVILFTVIVAALAIGTAILLQTSNVGPGKNKAASCTSANDRSITTCDGLNACPSGFNLCASNGPSACVQTKTGARDAQQVLTCDGANVCPSGLTQCETNSASACVANGVRPAQQKLTCDGANFCNNGETRCATDSASACVSDTTRPAVAKSGKTCDGFNFCNNGETQCNGTGCATNAQCAALTTTVPAGGGMGASCNGVGGQGSCVSGLICQNSGDSRGAICMDNCSATGANKGKGSCYCGSAQNVCQETTGNNCSAQNPNQCLLATQACIPDSGARGYTSSLDCYPGNAAGYNSQNPAIQCLNNQCVSSGGACTGQAAAGTNFCGGAGGKWLPGTISGYSTPGKEINVTVKLPNGQTVNGANVRLTGTTSTIVGGKVKTGLPGAGTDAVGDISCMESGTVSSGGGSEGQLRQTGTKTSGHATGDGIANWTGVNCFNSPFGISAAYTDPTTGISYTGSGNTGNICVFASDQSFNNFTVTLAAATQLGYKCISGATQCVYGQCVVGTAGCYDTPASCSTNTTCQILATTPPVTTPPTITTPPTTTTTTTPPTTTTTTSTTTTPPTTTTTSSTTTTTTTTTTSSTPPTITTTTPPLVSYSCTGITLTQNGGAYTGSVTTGDQMGFTVTGSNTTTGTGYTLNVDGTQATSGSGSGSSGAYTYTVPGTGNLFQIIGYASFNGTKYFAAACNTTFNRVGVTPPSLIIAKAVSPAVVAPGGLINVTLTVTNNGGTTALVNEVTDTLPTGFTYNGNPVLTTPSGTMPISEVTTGNNLVFTLNTTTGVNLAAGASLSITFSVKAPSVSQCTTYVNVATITSPPGGSSQANMGVCTGTLPNTGAFDSYIVSMLTGVGLVGAAYVMYRFDIFRKLSTRRK